MKTKLTDIGVERVSSDPNGRRELHDILLPGLVLRVTEQGSKSWSVIYRVAGAGEGGKRGKLRRMTLGGYPLIDLKSARAKARDALGEADRGTDPAHARDNRVKVAAQNTFDSVCERFVELHAKVNTEQWKATDRLLRSHAVAAWRGEPIEQITRATVHELLDSMIPKHGAAKARELRKHLSKMFNWAVDRGVIAASPLAGMRRPELSYVPRERVLAMDELKAVWGAAEEVGYPFGPMTQLLILTAQRRSEIAECRWSWMSTGGDLIEIPSSHYKTGRHQVVPLSAPAQAIVEALPRWNDGECIMSTTAGRVPVSGFSKSKARLDLLSKVEGWTIHDLRRSAATHMARLGVRQEHIERVLGHVIEGVAGTYNRYSYLAEKRAALDLWGEQWSK